MSNKSATERAEFLSQMAPNPSVTTAVLADDEPEFVESRLVGDPPVTYLEDSEAPAFVLTNKKRGMAAGGKHNQTKPDKGRGAIALVTGRRTLCLVGAEPDDKALEIPHTDVAKVSFHTGFLTKRLEIRTTRRVYHCWVSRGTETQILEDATAYIDDRAGADPDELEAEEMPSSNTDEQFTYRGKVVTKPSATDDQSGTEPEGDGATATATTDGGAAEAPTQSGTTPETVPDECVCHGCGERLTSDVNFCPTCGAELSSADPGGKPATETVSPPEDEGAVEDTAEETTDNEAAENTDDKEPEIADGEATEDNSTDTVMYRGREVDASYLK